MTSESRVFMSGDQVTRDANMLFLFVFICDTTSIFRDKSHMSTRTESQYLSEKHCKCLTATYSQLDLKVLAFIQQWQAD